MLCDWMLFPNSLRPNEVFLGIGEVFDSHMDEICSSAHKLKSNDVLASKLSTLQSSVSWSKRGRGPISLYICPCCLESGGR